MPTDAYEATVEARASLGSEPRVALVNQLEIVLRVPTDSGVKLSIYDVADNLQLLGYGVHTMD